MILRGTMLLVESIIALNNLKSLTFFFQKSCTVWRSASSSTWPATERLWSKSGNRPRPSRRSPSGRKTASPTSGPCLSRSFRGWRPPTRCRSTRATQSLNFLAFRQTSSHLGQNFSCRLFFNFGLKILVYYYKSYSEISLSVTCYET